MSLVDELFAELDIDEENTIKFFIVFTRFEYVLKRGGFLHGSEKKVEANWDKFASTLQTVFEPSKTEELQSAVQYFCHFPPKKQILLNKSLSWQDNAPDTKNLLIWLLLMIRTVRNNLFHGGKFPEGPVRDPSRNSELLGHSLVILNECLELCEQHNRDVYNLFFDRIE